MPVILCVGVCDGYVDDVVGTFSNVTVGTENTNNKKKHFSFTLFTTIVRTAKFTANGSIRSQTVTVFERDGQLLYCGTLSYCHLYFRRLPYDNASNRLIG